jgi:hypothetical protein
MPAENFRTYRSNEMLLFSLMKYNNGLSYEGLNFTYNKLSISGSPLIFMCWDNSLVYSLNKELG